MALQPFVGSWLIFQFLDLIHSGRITWTGDQPVERPLLIHRTTQTQNKHNIDICALSGIQTHDLSVPAGEDLAATVISIVKYATPK
jgi:hypothetical protein